MSIIEVKAMLLSEKNRRIFAVWCARQALASQENANPAAVAACDIAEKFANGAATAEEMAAAAAFLEKSVADWGYYANMAALRCCIPEGLWAACRSAENAEYAIARAMEVKAAWGALAVEGGGPWGSRWESVSVAAGDAAKKSALQTALQAQIEKLDSLAELA